MKKYFVAFYVTILVFGSSLIANSYTNSSYDPEDISGNSLYKHDLLKKDRFLNEAEGTKSYLQFNNQYDYDFSDFIPDNIILLFNLTQYNHFDSYDLSLFLDAFGTFPSDESTEPYLFIGDFKLSGAALDRVPFTTAAWLFGSGILGLIGIRRKLNG